MKFKLILFLLSISLALISQTDCNHGVSTDPKNPTNLNSLPLKADGSDNEKYLNRFDWFPIGAEGIYLGYDLSNMDFSGTPLPEMSNIMSDQGNLPYYDYIYNGPKPLTESGWELLLVNVGRYPNDINEITGSNDFRSFPYIVIYNKYLGKIRVFCKFGLDQTVHEAANAIELSLSFRNKNENSGAMRLYNGKNQSLDLYSEIITMSTITKAQNYAHKWYSADFQIAYDPCTCFYPSQIKLDFSQIKESTITMHSRTTTLNNQPLIDNTNLTVNPSDWLTGFDYSGNDLNNQNGGIAIARSMDNIVARYINELEQYKIDYSVAQANNVEVEKRLAVMKLFDKVVLKNAGTLVANLAGFDFWDDVDKFAKNLIGESVIDSTKLANEGKKYLASGINGLKTLISGEMKPLPDKPEIPVATFSESSYSGKIIDKADYGGPTFFTPGTYGSTGTGKPTITSVYSYPVYNEVLGTFALLRKPKIKISKLLLDEEEVLSQKSYESASGDWRILIQRYQTWSNTYKISIDEKLEYALNDVLDIKNHKISASFVIKAKRKDLDNNSHTEISAYHDTEKFVNIIVTNDSVDNYNSIYSYNKNYQKHYKTPIFNEFNWPLRFPKEINKIEFDFETPFIPLDALTPFESSFGIYNEAVNFKNKNYRAHEIDGLDFSTIDGETVFDLSQPEIHMPLLTSTTKSGYDYTFTVELRLLVDIEFNDLDVNGNPHRVTEIHTFEIDPSWINNNNLYGEQWSDHKPSDILKYKENIILHSIDFNGLVEVDGCEISMNKYTCRAWNDILIDGDLTTSNGYTVDIIAGNEINITPETEIDPKIELYITETLDYSQPMPKADINQVSDFCIGKVGFPSSYLANRTKSSISIENSVDEHSNSIELEKAGLYTVSLFPNPVSNRTVVQLSKDVDGTNVTLFDMMGRSIPLDINREGRDYYLNLSQLRAGSYMIKIINKEGTVTKHLIKK